MNRRDVLGRIVLGGFGPIADYRVVPTILDDQAEPFTLRSFVVRDGEPGAILA